MRRGHLFKPTVEQWMVATPRRGAIVGLLVALVFSLVSAAFADVTRRGILLRTQGVATVAEVTEVHKRRVARRSVNSPYIVRYRFQAIGSPRWYTHAGILWEGETHAGLTRPVWEEAARTRRLPVTYARSNPAVNAPAEATWLENPWVAGVPAATFGLIALGCWCWFAADCVALRRSRVGSSSLAERPAPAPVRPPAVPRPDKRHGRRQRQRVRHGRKR